MNKLCSRVRIVVENVLAGVKRCRKVCDLLRLTQSGISERVMEIACGMHNLRVTCRQPLVVRHGEDDEFIVQPSGCGSGNRQANACTLTLKITMTDY